MAPVPFLVLLLSLFLAPVRYFSCARTHARPAWCGPRDAHVTHPAYIAVPRASRSGRQDGGRASATRAAAAPVVRVGAGRPTVGPPGRGPARTLGGRRPPGGAKLFQNHTPILAAAAEDPPPLRGFATG